MTDTPARPRGAHGARGAGADDRAAFRAFVRSHHPDVGGDPETFRAGLTAFAETRVGTGRPAPAGWAASFHPDDPRLDAPITVVRGGAAGAVGRIGRAGRRLIRRYDPRPGSARVV